MCACRSSTGVGAGSRDRVHTQWPHAMDHEGLPIWFVIEIEILSFLMDRFDFIPCAFKS